MPAYYLTDGNAAYYCYCLLFPVRFGTQNQRTCRLLITQFQIPRFRSFRRAANHGALEAFGWLGRMLTYLISAQRHRSESKRGLLVDYTVLHGTAR